jgi:F0F1-type ATP synthase assembly protein I
MAPGEDRPTVLRSTGPYLNLGMTFALAIGGLAFLGNWLDGRWGTDPWLTITGAFLGMVVGFVNLVQIARRPGGGASGEAR